MNNSNFYELGIVLSGACILILILALALGYNEFKNKQKIFIQGSVLILLCIGGLIFCNTKRVATYKEVYYLEYTIYYPDNTCKFKVDSCNHIYSYSDKGTNRIKYYSISKKDTYSTSTTAPIVIDKIIKK